MSDDLILPGTPKPASPLQPEPPPVGPAAGLPSTGPEVRLAGSTLEERIREATKGGGLVTRPAGFATTDGDWSSIAAEGNPFAQLFLDAMQHHTISVEMVRRHHSWLTAFWEEKIREMNQGAMRQRIISKYGERVADYPARLDSALAALGSTEAIRREGERLDGERVARGWQALQPALAVALINGVLEPMECEHLVGEEGLRAGLTREECRRLILDELGKRGWKTLGDQGEYPTDTERLTHQWLSLEKYKAAVGRLIRPHCSRCGGSLDPTTGTCPKCKPNPVSKVPLIAFAVVVLAVGGYAGYRVFEGRVEVSQPKGGAPFGEKAIVQPPPPSGSGPKQDPKKETKRPTPPSLVTKATIVTTPPGASLVLDGGSVTGVSPMTADQLDPGSHTVKITLEGYQDVLQAFSISKGQNKEFDYILARVPTPTQTSTPPTTTTAATPPPPPPTSPQVPVPTPPTPPPSPPAKSGDMVLAEQEVDEAVALIDDGQYDNAITLLNSVIRRIPDYQRAKDQLVRAVRERKKADEIAREQLESVQPTVTKTPIKSSRP